MKISVSISVHQWLCFVLFFAASIAHAERPNIVFILSDDQAWTDYGFMGHPDIKTPHLDKLAEESLLFRRGYVAAPVCRPSLASMVTGLYPFDNYITGNDVSADKKKREEQDKPLRELYYQNPGFIQALTDSGYLAHQSGKWWEGSYQDGGFTHGMKDNPAARHGNKKSLEIGRKGLKPVTDFIDMALEKEKPFFLWYGVFLPHTPHNPPERLLEKYAQEGRAMDVAKYYAMCEWLDETCGELVGYLDEKGIRENTLIFYICDNGWAAKSTRADDPAQKGWNQYAQRSKTSTFENGIRTPIFINWPNQVAPTDDPNFAHAIDIFPTLAKAAGIEAPNHLPGIDLLDEKARNQRKIIFGTNYSTHNMTVGKPDVTLQYLWAIEGDWKLMVRYQGKDTTQYAKTHNWDTMPVRLYNLREDPHEENEVSAQHPEIVERLEKKIEAWHSPDPSVVSRMQ
ncbi:MAG: sulfatase-like hydrolase/transferase [Verrucomicrobiota bacterium]